MIAKEKKIITSTTTELLKILEIDGDFEFSEKDKDEGIDMVLNTQDSGMVIGYHGDTLDALQLILSLCVSKKLGEFKRISLEVGDYKKNRIEWLKNLALETKERVINENKEITLPQLKSWERRIVHLFLENDENVVSKSMGEGRDRVLTVSPKN